MTGKTMSPRRAGKPPAASPAHAISEGGLLADAFRGPSWNRWRAVLKAAFAEPMTEDEQRLFREVAERDPPRQRVKELWSVCGRRAGKDSVASAIATIAALEDYSAYLRPGERASILCLASTVEQSRIIHRYVTAYFANNPLLRGLVGRELDDGLELKNQVEIIVAANNYRSLRGKTIALVVLDEVAYWRDERSANPDTETYEALLPAMVTLPGSMLVGISTPHRRGGLLYERYRAAYGQNDADTLVVHGPSRMFNELLPQRLIDDAMERDPEIAAAEWLAQWRTDIGPYVDRANVSACVAPGVREIPPATGIAYGAFFDAAGGSGGDSMALAIAHADVDGIAVLDCLRERRPPFDPTAVVSEFGEVLRTYNVSRIRSDRFAGGWPVEAFARVGIVCEQSALPKSEQYRELLPMLNSRRVELLDHPKMVHQLCALEHRTTRAGRETISEPAGGHDDLANVMAGAITTVASETHPTLIRREGLLRDDKPVPMPRVAQIVFATMVVGADGQAAIVYFSHQDLLHIEEPPLVLLDFSVTPLSGSTIGDMFARLTELHRSIRGVSDHAAWVPKAFLPSIHMEGHDAETFADGLLEDLPTLALGAAAHINGNRFKVTDAAMQKGSGYPLIGALHFTAADKIDNNPLRIAILAGIAVALTPQNISAAPVIPAAHLTVN